MERKFLIDNLERKDNDVGSTLICCFSRKIFVPIFFKALDQMDLPRDNIHLLVYDNTGDPSLAEDLKEACQSRLTDYKSVRLYKSYLPPRYKVSGTEQPKFAESKIFNIFEMWKDLAELVHTDTFFQLEDDTIAPQEAYTKLFSVLNSIPKAALITGISTGRHADPFHKVKLGVYDLKVCPRKHMHQILERISFDPETKGVVPVMACGVYCFAARTKPFFSGLINFTPEKWDIPYWALDVWFTRNMRNQGYGVYADFDVWCTHLHAAGNRINAFGKDQAVQKADMWLPEYDNYALDIEVCPKENKREFKPAPTWEI